MTTRHGASDPNLLPQQIPPHFGGYALVPYGQAYEQQIPEEETKSLADYWQVLRKRYKIVAWVVTAFILGAVVYSFVVPKRYTATAGLEVRGYAPILSTGTAEIQFGVDTRKVEYVKTTIAKLTRYGTGEKILKNPELAAAVKSYFQNREGPVTAFRRYLVNTLGLGNTFLAPDDRGGRDYDDPSELVKDYMKLIDVDPIKETSLVEVSATTTSPELSRMIANAHAKGFSEQLQAERQESVVGNAEVLQKQSEDLKARLTASDRKLAEYAEKYQVVAMAKSGSDNPLVSRIDNLAKLLADATAKRIRSESLVKEVEGADVGRSTTIDDESIRAMRVQLKEAEAEYATLGQKVMPMYPSMVALRAKIQNIRRNIQDERRETARGLRSQYQSDVASERKLQEQIEKNEAQAHELSKRLIEYNIIARESDSLRGLYQAVIKQLEETQVSATGKGGSTVVVSDLAPLPSSPSSPPKPLFVVVSWALIGTVVGVALAFVAEFLDNTIGTGEDVQSSLKLPLLGQVPTFAATRGYFSRDALVKLGTVEADGPDQKPVPVVDRFVTITSPHAAVSEALRTIRAGIILSSADNPSRVVLVGSANKGDGKTTVTSNLAVTLAQASHRTLLIDGDLRQPRVHRMFNIPPERAGLVDFLAGQVGVDEIVGQSTVPNLDVIPAGSKAPNPAELVGSKKMRALIEMLREKYDYILIDSPPIVPVSDSLMLSRVVDSVVLVVRSLKTEKHLAAEAARRLNGVGARILGVVLNDVDSEKVGYAQGKMASAYYADVA